MHKRLYRSSSNRILGGVLGGIGDYLNVDPTVIRIIFIILTLFSLFFPCAIGYFLAYLIMPEERV
ncbi:MAG: PspC domain-containing protein [Sporolactobacillus sp.]